MYTWSVFMVLLPYQTNFTTSSTQSLQQTLSAVLSTLYCWYSSHSLQLFIFLKQLNDIAPFGIYSKQLFGKYLDQLIWEAFE